MTNQIPHISTLDEIEHRYESLHQTILRRLTDYYNFWLGLKLIAYGEDWQREDALERVNRKIREGRSAFPKTPTIEDFLKIESDQFSDSDRVHLRELQELRRYANQQAKGGIPREEAQSIYDHLVVMLYGSYGRIKLEAR